MNKSNKLILLSFILLCLLLPAQAGNVAQVRDIEAFKIWDEPWFEGAPRYDQSAVMPENYQRPNIWLTLVNYRANGDAYRPMQNNQFMYPPVLIAQDMTKNSFSHTWTNLPVNDANGNPIKYGVIEYHQQYQGMNLAFDANGQPLMATDLMAPFLYKRTFSQDRLTITNTWQGPLPKTQDGDSSLPCTAIWKTRDMYDGSIMFVNAPLGYQVKVSPVTFPNRQPEVSPGLFHNHNWMSGNTINWRFFIGTDLDMANGQFVIDMSPIGPNAQLVADGGRLKLPFTDASISFMKEAGRGYVENNLGMWKNYGFRLLSPENLGDNLQINYDEVTQKLTIKAAYLPANTVMVFVLPIEVIAPEGFVGTNADYASSGHRFELEADFTAEYSCLDVNKIWEPATATVPEVTFSLTSKTPSKPSPIAVDDITLSPGTTSHLFHHLPMFEKPDPEQPYLIGEAFEYEVTEALDGETYKLVDSQRVVSRFTQAPFNSTLPTHVSYTFTNAITNPPEPPEPPKPPTPTYPTLRVPLNAVKQLRNATLKEGQFSFLLKDSGGKLLARVQNQADGSVIFPERTFSKAVSNYLYTIEEEQGTQEGMSYDKTVYTVKITTTPEQGKLVASVAIEKDGVPYAGKINFTNVAKAPVTGDATFRLILLLTFAALGFIGAGVYLKRRQSQS